MNRVQLHRVVARLTGESVGFVKHHGFELVVVARRRRRARHWHRRTRLIARVVSSGPDR
jgi:hypothetical protein